jgi:hypothetical protein
MQETQDRSIEQLRILEKGGMADSRQVYELCTRDGFGHFNVMLGADRFVILFVRYRNAGSLSMFGLRPPTFVLAPNAKKLFQPIWVVHGYDGGERAGTQALLKSLVLLMQTIHSWTPPRLQ